MNRIDSNVIEAFHLMWGNFPEPVTLVNRSREVIAVNAACRNSGRMSAGMNCARQGPPEAHRGCLANQALSLQKPTYKLVKYGERKIVSYWLPLEGYPELFVHFGVGVTIDYNAIQKETASAR